MDKDLRIIILLCLVLVFFFLLIKDAKKEIILINRLKISVFSLYIISLIFPIQTELFNFGNTNIAAAFGPSIYLGVWHIILLFILFLPSKNVIIKKGGLIKWLLCFTSIATISYFYPHNGNPQASLVGIYYVVSLLCFAVIVYKKFNSDEIFKSLWNAFSLIIIIQFILALAFPVFQIEKATTLFYGKDAYLWANRGDRPSAVGTFGHPGPLGLISFFIFNFFFSAYLKGIRKGRAIILTAISLTVIILTKSRASYISIVLSSLMIIIFLKKDSFRKVFKYLLPISIVFSIIIVIFLTKTTLGNELFISGDLDNMETARLIHWYLGWKAFLAHPLLGTGINSHLSYISTNVLLIGFGLKSGGEDFYVTNPVHNSHLIVLCELGLLGASLWLYGFFYNLKINVKEIFKINSAKYTNLKSYDKFSSMFYLFTNASLISYFFYAFTGWASMNYYSLSFLILSILLSEKRRCENEFIINS